MFTKRLAFFGLAIYLVSPTILRAQETVRPQIGSGFLWALATTESGEEHSARIGVLGDGSKDHRYGGMWIGLGLGAMLTVVNYARCSNPDTGCSTSRPLIYGPIMTVVLGTTGALIGAQIPKAQAPQNGP